MRDLGAVLVHEEPCRIRYAIKCRSVAASSAQRRHGRDVVKAHMKEAA
jgi:hypothetical protein